MQPDIVRSDFLPSSLEGWFTIVSGVGVGVTSTWLIIKNRIKADVDAVRSDVNGIGNRVLATEQKVITLEAQTLEAKDAWRESRQDRGTMREQIAEMRRSQATLDETLRDMQVNIIAEIQKTRDVVSKGALHMRERLTRLETVTEIEKKTGVKISIEES